jgi:hypothetical protein
MDGDPIDDERLLSLIEQADAIVKAWTVVAASEPRSLGDEDMAESCPFPAELGDYATGRLAPSRSGEILDHLGRCRVCRAESRCLRALAAAESGSGVCALALLQNAAAILPDRVAHVLAGLSRAISDRLAPVPAGGERWVEPDRFADEGIHEDDWGATVRSARVDSRSRLRLKIDVRHAGDPVRLVVFLAGGGCHLNVGAATLAPGTNTVTMELGDLWLSPGYLRPEDVEYRLEALEPRVEDAGATGPLLHTDGAAPVTTELGHTLVPPKPATTRNRHEGVHTIANGPGSRDTIPRRPKGGRGRL